MKTSLVIHTPGPPSFATLVALALSLALLFSGCTSITTASSTQLADLTASVRRGDEVDCTLRDGSHAKFKVASVEPNALVGDTQRVAAADLVEVKIARFNGKETLYVAVGVAAIIGATYLWSKSLNHLQIYGR